MKRKLSAITREKLRAAALLRPRANGRFATIRPAPAEATGAILPETPEGEQISASDEVVRNDPVVHKTAKAPRKKKLSRKTLVARVSTSIERELFAVEQLLNETGATSTQDAETERRARTLASLARSLRELSQLQPSGRKPKTDDTDAIPRDIDELRRELARRLDALVADATAAHPDLPGDAME